jgi:pyruvate dehydrogenase E2 component (dihydrolipoamide acetyltransferase)
MEYKFIFPDIGEGIAEGQIITWLVKPGDQVDLGTSLLEVETDKVTTEIPSSKPGTVLKTYGAEGETIHVGDTIVLLEVEGDEPARQDTNEAPKPVEAQTEQVEPASDQVDEEEVFGVVGTIEQASGKGLFPPSREGFPDYIEYRETGVELNIHASPLARVFAKELNISLESIKGSGPQGRIRKRDVLNQSSSTSSTGTGQRSEGFPEHVEPLSGIRKTIAKNMVHSKHTAAHMSVFEEAVVDDLYALRAEEKDGFLNRGVKLTFLAFIVKAVVRALQLHPSLNAKMDLEKGEMTYFDHFSIGIAADTDRGLVVPVIKHAQALSLFEIAEEIQRLTQASRNNSLNLQDMKNGTFTITNFGSIGGQFATPVINYPQAGILGLGRIMEKPIVKNGAVVPAKVMGLSLSADHRIVDGGEATRFINDIKAFLEHPARIFMG